MKTHNNLSPFHKLTLAILVFSLSAILAACGSASTATSTITPEASSEQEATKALNRIDTLINIHHYSKQEAKTELMKDGVSESEADAALGTIPENTWNATALEQAKQDIEIHHFCKAEAEAELTKLGFEKSQIEYALENISEDVWNAAALAQVRQDIEIHHYSYAEAEKELTKLGFSASQLKFALDNISEDTWNASALEQAKQELGIFHGSPIEVREALTKDGFTEPQIEYALDNISEEQFEIAAYEEAAQEKELFNYEPEKIYKNMIRKGFTDGQIDSALSKLTNGAWVSRTFDKEKAIYKAAAFLVHDDYRGFKEGQDSLNNVFDYKSRLIKNGNDENAMLYSLISDYALYKNGGESECAQAWEVIDTVTSLIEAETLEGEMKQYAGMIHDGIDGKSFDDILYAQ